jgi:predicted GH43/DUF377 family glycosyl hydrolase
MTRLATALLLLGLAGCGRYADFTLPTGVNSPAHWPQLTLDPAPVLLRDSASDVLNPSVLAWNGQLWNFYSEYDGHTWHTALAQSADGIAWKKLGRIVSPDPNTWEGSYIAANGSAAYEGGRWLYWYVAGPETRPHIGLATGTDPSKLQKSPRPVLSPGPRGSFDELAVADPYVIRIGAYWYMYYLGEDRARRQQIGLARSTDGVTWYKLRSNPVLAIGEPGGMDDRGLGEPAVWQLSDWYWMLFTGRDATENRTLGIARSKDGVHWERSPEIIHGSETWDSKVLCDPTVVVDRDRMRVWFGGGDVASPDQNLHGQIGAGEMKWGPEE